MPRSRFGIFHKEHTQSTPFDPKLTFWCVSYYLGAFGTIWLPYGTRCKTGRTSAKVRATKSRWHFSQRTHQIHPIGPQTQNFGVFCTIWEHLGPFGCLTQFGSKRAELVQKFVPRSRVRIFCKERTRSPLLDPKLMLGAFRTIWVHLAQLVAVRNSVQNGPNKCKSSCHEVALEFFATNAPIQPIGP